MNKLARVSAKKHYSGCMEMLRMAGSDGVGCNDTQIETGRVPISARGLFLSVAKFMEDLGYNSEEAPMQSEIIGVEDFESL